MGDSGWVPRGKPAATELGYPTYDSCRVLFSVSIIRRTLDMDYRILNVHTGVNACNCTRACKDIVRESALKVDSGRKKKEDEILYFTL